MTNPRRLRSSVYFPLFALVAVGCGVFGGTDAEVAGPATPAGEPPLPPGAPPPTTGTPSTDEVTEAFGVFVAPSGSDQNDGTRRSPFASIGAAMQAAKPQAKRVYVCTGTYTESLELVSAVSVIGGYDCSDATAWKRASGARSKIAGKTIPAVRAKDIASTTRFEGFDVTAPDATDPGSSSIGLWAVSAGKLAVADASITAGRGADGAPGVAPPAPETGEKGGDAIAGVYEYAKPQTNIWPYPAAAAGGTSACGGEAGGAGGRGGVWICNVEVNPTLGNYLTPATRFNVVTQQDVAIGPAVAPTAIASLVGAAGNDGASATSPGRLSSAGFEPSDGTVGGPGAGGKGGAGGTAEQPARGCTANTYWTLANGPAGGAGGCGGVAGKAGRGGGASIAAFVVVSGGLTFTGVALASGTGGTGGEGSFGSEPSPGAPGGTAIGKTGVASPGSAGGRAGVSGSGAGGSSFGLVYSGGAPVQTDTTVKAGAPGAGVPEKTWTSSVSGQKATLPASAAGEAKDVASF